MAVLSSAAVGNIVDVIRVVGAILNAVVPVLISLALAYFLWGVGQYVLASDNEEKRAESRRMMIWGIIAIFVMISVFALVRLIGETFGIGVGGGTITPPQLAPGAGIPRGLGF